MDSKNYKWNYKTSFVNPYNFVSSDFSKKKPGEGLLADQGKCTGILKCRLITKTPIAVPGDVIKEDPVNGSLENVHKTYEFFNYGDGNYVIPGSSLRGAVRSVYETITDSCYVTAQEDGLFTRRNTKPPYKPGVLIKENGTWKLYPADRYIFKINDYKYFNQDAGCYDAVFLKDLKKKMTFGDKVSFEVSSGETDGYYKRGYLVGLYARNIKKASKSTQGEHTGYLYVGERFSRKHFESIFEIKGKPIRVDNNMLETAIKRLEETIRLYNDPSINKQKKDSWYGDYEKAEQKGAIPLWYSYDKDMSFLALSMACLGRVAYQNTVGDLLKKKVPCKERDKLCKACELFGMTSADKGISSRVRFTDAVIKKDDIVLTENQKIPQKILAELASPKPSYLPFYLKNFDSKNNNTKGYDEKGAELRGRKYYWHSHQTGETKKITVRNATMEVIQSKKNGFEFRVFYDHISQRQLDELIWTLTLGENDPDSSLCYKIGHGKPIGLGSAKIVIDEQIERSVEGGYSLESQDIVVKKDIFPNDRRKQELLKIMDMNSVGDKDVRYPYVDGVDGASPNDLAAHRWFSNNYKLGDSKVEHYLPDIKEKLSMPSLTYVRDNNYKKR